MISNRLISSKSIIAKVIADLQLPESQIRISDMREYIMEAMLKIGAIQQFDHKVVTLPIECGQVSLPCDLYKLDQVAYSYRDCGTWYPMRKATSSFGVYSDAKHCKCEPRMYVQDTEMFPLVKNMFNLNTDREALDKLNSDENLRKTLSILLNRWTEPTVNGRYMNRTIGNKDSTMYSWDLQYMTKPGYLMTNVPYGFVKIAYYAIYTDEESMPLIPDSEAYKEAIFWYITMKLMYPKKLVGDISPQDYADMRSSWLYYKKQAYGEAMTPGPDDMINIEHIWRKMYPEYDGHDQFYSTTGEEQRQYNQDNLINLI